MSYRFIEEGALRRVIRQAIPNIDQRGIVLAAVDRFLARQPRTPRLVGTTVAATILGVKPPHVTRLAERGRMPDPVEVDGSVTVYVRDEVEELGAQLHAERQARAQKRAGREEEA